MSSDGGGWAAGERGGAPRVAVVIPTFRRPREVGQLIDSLIAGSVVPDHIVVVDNDPEASCEEIERPGFTIEVVHLGAGLNLPGARNAGWRAAEDADVVFFVDDDNIVGPDTVQQLVEAIAAPNVGLVAPLIFCADPSDMIWSGGIRRSLWTTRTWLLHRGETSLPAEAVWATEDAPDALAIRREVLEEVQGFDEANFPFGHDEADITARIGALGFERLVARDAHIWHEGGVPGIWDEYKRSPGLHGDERLRLNWRGRVLFHRRYSISPLQRIVAVGAFVPAGAAIATVISAAAPGPVRTRVASCLAIWRGILDGYRWSWRSNADELAVERA